MTATTAQFPLFSYSSLGSTMDEARRIARTGFSGMGIVRADTQTTGRGRIAGRQWIDAPGQSLLMTIILPEGSASVQALPLRVGLGIARALEASAEANLSGARPLFWLKWPNDVLAARNIPHRGETPEHPGAPNRANALTSAEAIDASGAYGKICGILCETVDGRALAGIGINARRAALNTPAAALPPLSLEEALGTLPPLWQDFDGAARTLARAVLESIADPEWKRGYEVRLWGHGERLRFLAGHPKRPEIIEGICEGVDDNGSLILSRDGSARAFASGEISSR